MNGWMDEWMNGWMDEGMNGWMDEWMNNIELITTSTKVTDACYTF